MKKTFVLMEFHLTGHSSHEDRGSYLPLLLDHASSARKYIKNILSNVII